MERPSSRVERRPSGWYDTAAELYEPLLADVWRPDGAVAGVRRLVERLRDVERRGA